MPPRPLLFLSPIHKAGRRIAVHLGAALAGLGISESEGHLLSYLRSYSPRSIAELHEVFGLKRSTLTSTLDRLEARGLLRRDLHPDDGRSYLVRLTDAGRQLAERVRAPVEDLERAIRSRVTDDDLAGFRNVLDAIGRVTAGATRTGRAAPTPSSSSPKEIP